ncbi:hypothetical protein BMS3Abin05_01978 [bacterium BMS3Abin05]|nr:hypothetical protein BMS3Abin05_01978 [bacterium BMS3Abin05]GBE27383.1 hypothetical protein BMS3Bbin03_01308 [bacterium BMS3Bbin03]HDZ13081.1 PorV/PorQ family protein [Bacteroidota bacterium]
MKRILYVLGGVIISAFLGLSQSTAQTVKSGTTAAQFLKIGIGARSVGMGEAFVATANDISAIYWNPAGLSSLTANEAIFFHTDWLAGISYDFAAFSIPLGEWGTFGGFFAGLTVPSDKVRTVHDPEGTGEFFGASDIALGISYARKITDRFSFGMNAKYIKERIWNMAASAVAVDVGTIYRSQFHDLRIGMMMSNFGTQMQMAGRNALLFVDIDPTLNGNNEAIRAQLEMEKWSLPLQFRVGMAIDPVKNDLMRLTVGADAVHPNDNMEFVNFGMEYAFKEMLFVRGGYRGLGINQLEGGLTLGGGFQYRFGGAAKISLNYAYANYGRLNSVNRYSISVVF